MGKGEVETFDLTGHSKAQRCYAWFYTDDKGENQYTIVLAIPPVNSPENAVKAAIGASARPDKSTVGKALNKVWALVLRSSQTPFEKPFERTVSGFPPQADQPMAGRRRVSGCRRCR